MSMNHPEVLPTLKKENLVLRQLNMFMMFLFCCLIPASSRAQEVAEFALRGTIVETFTTPEGEERALVHAALNAFNVTCPAANCANDLFEGEGECADIWGDLISFLIIPPATEEYLVGSIVQAPSNCSTERALFLLIGHVVNYTTVGPTGNFEFDVSVNGNLHHVICPTGSSCGNAVQTAYFFGRCMATNGNMKTVLLGFSSLGDTWVEHRAVSVQVFGSNNC